MKRYSNIFDKIVDIENIKLAHNNASKGKRKYKEEESEYGLVLDY